MGDLSTFRHFYKLADNLIEQSTKEQLAECAQLLAWHHAHYQGLHGEIPLDRTLFHLDSTDPQRCATRSVNNWSGESCRVTRQYHERTK